MKWWAPRPRPRGEGVLVAILTFRLWPAADWRRIVEFAVAAYQASVGAVAFVHPETLLHTSYKALLDMFPPQQWGLNLWCVALMHATCISLRRRPLASATLRAVACALHFGVMCLIAFAYFRVEDYYRLVTTVFLILAVIAATSIATEDIARIILVRRAIADERRP